MSNVHTSADQINFTILQTESMPVPQRVLMVHPAYFDVVYEINPHMVGNIGSVDPVKAEQQWSRLREGFQKTGLEVITLDGKPGLPDLVFTANQSLPFCDNEGNKKVIMSIMCNHQRRGEVPLIETWFRNNGYKTLHLDKNSYHYFEGMGDAIWHFNRKLLWGGYGPRSSREAFDEISQLLGVPVVLLELQDERFYHLDTCFCCLDENSVLIHPPAFNNQGLEMIHQLFDTVIEANPEEAEHLLATNAASPDGKHILMQKGCTNTAEELRSHGFQVLEFDLSQYLKSGGSVYCMKLMIW